MAATITAIQQSNNHGIFTLPKATRIRETRDRLHTPATTASCSPTKGAVISTTTAVVVMQHNKPAVVCERKHCYGFAEQPVNQDSLHGGECYASVEVCSEEKWGSTNETSASISGNNNKRSYVKQGHSS